MAIAVVDLLQELTDIDTLHESEEGAEVLIDALVSFKFLSVCVVSMQQHLLDQYLSYLASASNLGRGELIT